MFGLCDCNNFYASCERVFNPALNGKPVVVLSNNDGCVIARSNEAKAIGIKMGQPLYQIKDIIKRHEVNIYSCNFTLYGDMSRRVMNTLREMTPSIEVYSIDEAFIDLRGIDISALNDMGHKISQTIKRNTGIPVSIGIAPTKTLAKIASKLCKKYPKLKGACLMYKKEDIEKVLRKFPIEDVWGIGRRYSKMLMMYGITTAYDFTLLTPEWVKAKMSIVGLRTWRELRGESCIGFEDNPQEKQSISTSRTFAHETDDFDAIRTAIITYITISAEKLRRQNSVCSELCIYIYTSRYRDKEFQRYENVVIKLETATDSTIELGKIATNALKQIYVKGYKYKKAGVILSDLVSKNNMQLSLFDCSEEREKQSRIMETIDTINCKYGKDKIGLALNGGEAIALSREHLSARYTTNWDEILKVKV